MDESFAAAGLGSGAAGQARLALSTELLGSLSALDSERAARSADIAARRTEALAEYRSAIASAIAQNETARAQALYEEAVRVDESYREAEYELELQESYLSELSSFTGVSGAAAGGGPSGGASPGAAAGRGGAAASRTTGTGGGGGGKALIAVM